MATSRHVMLTVIVTLMVLFVGSAHAGGYSCPYGYKNCGYKEKDCKTCILNDVKNCGDCHNECRPRPFHTVKCENKQCVYKKKCYADTKRDVNNCGECGHQCKVEWQGGVVKCYDGQCKQHCKYGYEYDWKRKCCVKKCHADTRNDVNNCGECGHQCKVEWQGGVVKCYDGQCKQHCKYGYEYDWKRKCCVKKCHADTRNDVNNCGECGHQCKVEWQGGVVKCYDGECKQHCRYGYEYDWKRKCCVEKKH